MKKTKIIILFSLFLLLPSVLSAQEEAAAEIMEIGGYEVRYDEEVEFSPEIKAFYLDGGLVLSRHDTDADGKVDQWLVYGEGAVLETELADLDGDGEPDYIAELDPEESANTVIAPEYEIDRPELPPIKRTERKVKPSSNERLEQFSLDPPPARDYEKGFSIKYVFYILILAVAGYFIYRAKKKS